MSHLCFSPSLYFIASSDLSPSCSLFLLRCYYLFFYLNVFVHTNVLWVTHTLSPRLSPLSKPPCTLDIFPLTCLIVHSSNCSERPHRLGLLRTAVKTIITVARRWRKSQLETLKPLLEIVLFFIQLIRRKVNAIFGSFITLQNDSWYYFISLCLNYTVIPHICFFYPTSLHLSVYI